MVNFDNEYRLADMTTQQSRIVIISGMILGVALVRLLALPFPNFAPIGAMALFGATYFKQRSLAFILPLTALFITDAIIGFHQIMPFVYGAFVATGMIGLLLRNNVKTGHLALAGLASSILFFLVTNFGVWVTMPGPKNMATLMVTYELGLPFFQYTLLGDFFFISVLFGSFALLKQRIPALQSA